MAVSEFDTTSLSEKNHGLKVHRDYLAHTFRWGWAARWIGQGHRVFEPGCGSETPLAFVLMRAVDRVKRPDLYVGCDLNAIPFIKRQRGGTSASTFHFLEHFNFVERWPEVLAHYGPIFDTVVSFEVIEHMDEASGDEYLRGCWSLLPVDGRLLISTPVFNGHAASNHIREYSVAEFAGKLERVGFSVQDRFGTFASYNDIKRGLRETYSEEVATWWLEQYARCREFYSDDVLACFLAPLFPDYSRNNVWVCKKVGSA